VTRATTWSIDLSEEWARCPELRPRCALLHHGHGLQAQPHTSMRRDDPRRSGKAPSEHYRSTLDSYRSQKRRRRAKIRWIEESRLDEARMPAVPTLLRPHRESLPSPSRRQRMTPRGPTQFASFQPDRLANQAKAITSKSPQIPKNQASASSSRSTPKRSARARCFVSGAHGLRRLVSRFRQRFHDALLARRHRSRALPGTTVGHSKSLV
jgi:hypothetical protein